jgi:hypothetical protein
VTSCSTAKSSTRCGRLRSSSKAGDATTIRSARMPLSATGHQHRRSSCLHYPRGRLSYADRLRRPRWRYRQPSTNIPLGPLNVGRSKRLTQLGHCITILAPGRGHRCCCHHRHADDDAVELFISADRIGSQFTKCQSRAVAKHFTGDLDFLCSPSGIVIGMASNEISEAAVTVGQQAPSSVDVLTGYARPFSRRPRRMRSGCQDCAAAVSQKEKWP